MSTGGDQESREDRTGKGILERFPKDLPKGVRVMLMMEDDSASASLKHVEQYLKELEYEVTTCDSVATALSMLHADRNMVDIILCMDNVGGFNLLENISEDKIPVAMISNDGGSATIINCIRKGACDCLVSPVEKKDLRFLYKHLISNMVKRSRNNEEVNKEVGDCSSASTTPKKARMAWSPELKEKFKAAVEHLGGPEEARPNKILKWMGDKGLTRAHVASRLQKHRMRSGTLPGSSNPNPPSHQMHPSNQIGLSQSIGRLVDGCLTSGTIPQNAQPCQPMRLPTFTGQCMFPGGLRATPYGRLYSGDPWPTNFIPRFPELPHLPTSANVASHLQNYRSSPGTLPGLSYPNPPLHQGSMYLRNQIGLSQSSGRQVEGLSRSGGRPQHSQTMRLPTGFGQPRYPGSLRPTTYRRPPGYMPESLELPYVPSLAIVQHRRQLRNNVLNQNNREVSFSSAARPQAMPQHLLFEQAIVSDQAGSRALPVEDTENESGDSEE